MGIQRYLPSTVGTAFTGMVPAVSGGDYVLYADHLTDKQALIAKMQADRAAEVARLKAEVEKHKERRQHFENLLNNSIRHENEWTKRALKAEAEVARLTGERDALHQQLADVLEISTVVPFDRCILHAGERLAGRLLAISALEAERDATVAAKERAEEALRDLDTLFEFAMGPTAEAFVINAAGNEHLRKAFAKADAILAGHAPATKGEGDE